MDLLPAVFLLIPGSVVVAYLITRFGRYRWAVWIGWVITTIACGLLILLDMHTPKVVFSVALAVFGVGAGMVLTSVNIAIQAACCMQDRAMGACMYGFMRSLGMAFGVGVG